MTARHELRSCSTTRLADYLEGDLGARRARRAVQAHVASCVRCTALVRDLAAVFGADAGELPELSPSRDLWAASRSASRRRSCRSRLRATPNVARAAPRHDRLRLAAVAAALVAVTAGVTYTLTARRGANAGAKTVAHVAIDSTSRDSAQRRVPVPRDLAGSDTAVARPERRTQAARARPAAQAVSATLPAVDHVLARDRPAAHDLRAKPRRSSIRAPPRSSRRT